MAQNEQNLSNSTSLKEVATTVASSTSPGTATNTIALAVVLWCSLSNIVPPLRPSVAINLLEEAIREVIDIYDAHKGILRDRESFQVDLKRIELAVLELKEKYIQDSLNRSWMALPSLPQYLSREKYAWTTARAHGREVDALKSKLMLAVIKAKKGLLQTPLRVGTVDDQKENQGTKPTMDASIICRRPRCGNVRILSDYRRGPGTDLADAHRETGRTFPFCGEEHPNLIGNRIAEDERNSSGEWETGQNCRRSTSMKTRILKETHHIIAQAITHYESLHVEVDDSEKGRYLPKSSSQRRSSVQWPLFDVFIGQWQVMENGDVCCGGVKARGDGLTALVED
ncbi:hypothetical protein IW262DRAFT_1297585 [Armillaria fumosa]|nr:hypothetical protein IW262DRAFT_1297585 [Armillaria fumosa]